MRAVHSPRFRASSRPLASPAMKTPEFLYLASQSPRRSQLLGQLGIVHRVLVADAAEEDVESLESVLPGEVPRTYVARVTGLKLDAAVARRARRGEPAGPILCADTTVALGRTIFGKPADAEDAARMLAALAGRTHRVLTAVAVQAGSRRSQALSESRVTFAAMSTAQIDRYVATGEPLGKAGAYGIQGAAAAFVQQISGSYTGIMGLPLFETAELLRPCGFPV